MKVHSNQMSNSLGGLVKMIIGASPVKDSHLEQAEKDRIIDMSPINLT